MTKTYAGTGKGLINIKGNSVEFKGHSVRALSIDNGLWSVVDDHEVWFRERKGSWIKKADSEESIHCLLPSDRGLYMGGSNARLFLFKENTLREIKNFQDVKGRETWFNPAAPAPSIRSMAHDNVNIYVNVHVGGILRSPDRDDIWNPTIYVNSDVHQVYWDPESDSLLAATAVGLATSADQGDSWDFQTNGLHATYLRAVTTLKDHIFITASTGPYSNQGAIYRKRRSSSKPFEKCHNGLPEWFSGNINTYCLTANEKEVIFAGPDGKVYISYNRGNNWEILSHNLGKIHCLASE